MSKTKQTKESLLLELSSIMLEPWLKPHIEAIGRIRTDLLGFTTDEEEIDLTNKIRAKIQKEGIEAWKYYGKEKTQIRGAIIAATGIGKSKMAIDAIMEYMKDPEYMPNILVVVPTERLRDTGWREEFKKWNALSAYVNAVETICYASLDTVKGKNYDLVVLDEGHNITTANSVFFTNNTVKDIMMLTATKPTSFEKVAILQAVRVKPVYEMSLDEAVKLGIVAPYSVTVVTMPVDKTRKYIKKWKRSEVMCTEAEMLNYHNMSVFTAKNPRARLNRMQFIYKLQSKTEASKRLLAMVGEELKGIIFCANKAQAIELCDYRYFTKPSLAKADAKDLDKIKEYRELLDNWQGNSSLNKFLLGEINRVSCVNALNEGHNLGMIDVAFIAQLNSKQLHFIQRIGRILRWYGEHKGEIVILVARDTIDEEWARKATRGLETGNIKWLRIEDVLEGRETLLNNNNIIYEPAETANI